MNISEPQPRRATRGSAPSHHEQGHPQRWLILAILCTCLVLIVASVSSLNIAIPSIQQALGATQSEVQWIVDAYALVFAGLLLPAGAIGDRYGRKWTLLGGLALFAIASTVASTAGSPTQLIAMRAVMGIGAAFIMPSTLSLLTSVFPPSERQKAIAVWAGFAGAGGAIGVVASGALLDSYWWGSVFFIVVPIAAIALALIAFVVPNSRDHEDHPLDPIGALLSIVGLSGLVYAIIEGPTKGWSDPLVVGGFVAAAVLLVGFVLWELHNPEPMLDPRFFRIPRFAIGAATITIGFFAMFSLFFAVSQYFQYVRDYSPLKSGLATLPFAITMIIVAPRGVAVAEKLTVRVSMALGMAMIGIGLLGMGLVRADSPYLFLVLFVAVMACGAGLSNPPSTASIMTSLPINKAGVGSAVNDTTREVGGALGIAVVGSLIASAYRSHVGHALSMLPEPLRAQARDNVGAASIIGKEVFKDDPNARASYMHEIGVAFTHGMNVGLVAAGALSLIGAGLALRYFERGTRTLVPHGLGIHTER
jgi:EmrB/QacA subfamily drug resistance transporter